jgi:dihydroorotate dehydrogenase
MSFPSPVGISHVVDPHGVATLAMARFGVGFIEVGPIAVRQLSAGKPVERLEATKDIWLPGEPVADNMDVWAERLARRKCERARRLARLTVAAGTAPDLATAECLAMVNRLVSLVDAFVLATCDACLKAGWSPDDWSQHVKTLAESAPIQDSRSRLWLALRSDLTAEQRTMLVSRALAAGCRGVIVEGRMCDPATGGWIAGRSALPHVRESVRQLRTEFGNELSLIAGGIHEPVEALELRRLGASGVVIDSGLVYSGPGLPKRINEVVLYADHAGDRATMPQLIPIQKFTWFWTMVLGVAMLLGGMLAIGIASTRVILPYDEVFVGMPREQLNQINPRLLAFMKHDRVTLSGTMFAVALLYLFLSWYGIRRGIHWAMVSVLVSAFVGFLSFFFFLGFGYFDPFHAFITAVLFQFLLLAWQGELAEPQFTTLPNLRETPAWRWSQWGQLLFVIHGAVLVTAGAVISTYGCTTVFVPEDLEFMDVCASDLALANPRLIPLIAHDRASFGGMLISSGIAVLLSSLWGMREGARWQWWMLLLSGLPAYAAAIGVHLVVGYTSWWHLAPAYGGLALLIFGLALLWEYLGRDNPDLRVEWNRLTLETDAHRE